MDDGRQTTDDELPRRWSSVVDGRWSVVGGQSSVVVIKESKREI